MAEKIYKTGLYGGKFMPMHLGHYHCLQTAARECETVYCILFYNTPEEYDIHNKYPNDKTLRLDARVRQLFKVCGYFKNVIPIVLDVSECNGNLNAETHLVLEACNGQVDAIYGTNINYTDEFKDVYPFAIYRCLDPERKHINISGKELRAMSCKERKEWLV